MQTESDAAEAPAETDEPEELPDDGRLVLFAGFSIGLVVAGVFLIYVVMEAARLLT